MFSFFIYHLAGIGKVICGNPIRALRTRKEKMGVNVSKGNRHFGYVDIVQYITIKQNINSVIIILCVFPISPTKLPAPNINVFGKIKKNKTN